MSTSLLVILTVAEIVALVIVLALFVLLLTSRLRSIADSLKQLSGGVIRAIQGDTFLVSPGAAILNRMLGAIADVLPVLAAKAESLPGQQAQTAPARGAGAQDPVITQR